MTNRATSRPTVSTVLRLQLTEAAAGDVFQRADSAGDLVTMELVRQRLAELAAHPHDRRRDAARVVRPESVYHIASAWQHQINATRARALR